MVTIANLVVMLNLFGVYSQTILYYYNWNLFDVGYSYLINSNCVLKKIAKNALFEQGAHSTQHLGHLVYSDDVFRSNVNYLDRLPHDVKHSNKVNGSQIRLDRHRGTNPPLTKLER